MPNDLLQMTLAQAVRSLARTSPKYLGTRSIATALTRSVKLLNRWFIKEGPVLELDRHSPECVRALRRRFSLAELSVLEEGLKKLQRIQNPYRLVLEESSKPPGSRVTIEVTRSGNRLYDVRLLSAETRTERGWTLVPLQDVSGEQPAFVRQLYALRVMPLDETTALTHLRCRLVAAAVHPAESHLVRGELGPQQPGSISEIRLRVHALPPGVRAALQLRAKADGPPFAVVMFAPPLAPGQVADYSLLVRHENAAAFTAEAAASNVPLTHSGIGHGLVASRAIRVTTSTAALELTAIFPRGYTIAEPSLVVTDTHDLIPFPDEARRVYAAGGLSLAQHGHRPAFQLRVERPVIGATYRVLYRPPREASLPRPLRDSFPEVSLKARSPRTRSTRSMQKPRRR